MTALNPVNKFQAHEGMIKYHFGNQPSAMVQFDKVLKDIKISSPEQRLNSRKILKFAELQQATKTGIADCNAKILQSDNEKASLQNKIKPFLCITGALSVALAIGVAVAAVFLWPLTVLTLALLSVAAVVSIALGIIAIVGATKYPTNLQSLDNEKHALRNESSMHELLNGNKEFAEYVINRYTYFPGEQDNLIRIRKDTNMLEFIRENLSELEKDYTDFNAPAPAAAAQA